MVRKQILSGVFNRSVQGYRTAVTMMSNLMTKYSIVCWRIPGIQDEDLELDWVDLTKGRMKGRSLVGAVIGYSRHRVIQCWRLQPSLRQWIQKIIFSLHLVAQIRCWSVVLLILCRNWLSVYREGKVSDVDETLKFQTTISPQHLRCWTVYWYLRST